ncbi:MAG: CRISPR-associated protein Cas5 [Acidobacteria bacterium]|nr:MAG: CRISPR-associated protein Cas5 [Acidobacteriota bacterium]
MPYDRLHTLFFSYRKDYTFNLTCTYPLPESTDPKPSQRWLDRMCQ